jgi:hypothetical protein
MSRARLSSAVPVAVPVTGFAVAGGSARGVRFQRCRWPVSPGRPSVLRGHDRRDWSSVGEDCWGPSGWKSPTRPPGVGSGLEMVVP